MAVMESLSNGVAWQRDPLFSFRRSRAEMESEFGPAQTREFDSNGMGTVDAWTLRFSCGLELLVWAHHMKSDGSPVPPNQDTWFEVHANECDFAHIAAHLPFELRAVSPWLPDRRTRPSARWQVMRRDDNGNVFAMRACSTRCEADRCADTFEGRGHKQSYWVEERGEDRAEEVRSRDGFLTA